MDFVIKKAPKEEDIIKRDGNKAYFESPYDHKYPTVVGIGKEVIGFGESLPSGGERYVHFKKNQWEAIKKFVDEEIEKH